MLAEEQRLIVPCAMEDVDNFYPAVADTIKDQVVVKWATADAVVFVTRNERKSARGISELHRLGAQFRNERQRAGFVVPGNEMSDLS